MSPVSRAGGRIADVLIVGAGPVGVLLGAELARLGVPTVMLERRAEPGGGSRAVGVHGAALAAMEASGATDRLLAGARRVRVGEARRRGSSLGLVRFDRLRTRHPYVATLPQSATEAALAATAAAWGAPAVQRGAAVEALLPREDRVEVRGHVRDGMDGAAQAWEARIVVVAGGLRSRTLLPGDRFRICTRRYSDRYLMTDAADLGDDGDRAVVHLDPDGVLESFPLPGSRRRYVAWMPPADDDDEDGRTARLRRAVAVRTGSDAAASAVTDATAFGVARSRLSALRADRVIAIGDTAHEVSPIGGQGMNLGLIDAVTLAPLLARWIRTDGDADAAEAALAALTVWERVRLRAADRAGAIAAVNTALGRPARSAGALGVRAALATPAGALLAHAYSMGFDPSTRMFATPRPRVPQGPVTW